jgi:hypothetical protein
MNTHACAIAKDRKHRSGAWIAQIRVAADERLPFNSIW